MIGLKSVSKTCFSLLSLARLTFKICVGLLRSVLNMLLKKIC